MKASIGWCIISREYPLVGTIRYNRGVCLRDFERDFGGVKWKNIKRNYPHLSVRKVKVEVFP